MIMDRNDLSRDWGPSALNAANQVSLSTSYDLPFGKGKLWGGWQINQITTLLSGFPFTPVIGANRSGDGDTRNPDRPSLNPGFTGPVVTGNPFQWFNPNAFIQPAAGTYGNVGRGVYLGPGLADLDVSLIKMTRSIGAHESAVSGGGFQSSGITPTSACRNQTVFSGPRSTPRPIDHQHGCHQFPADPVCLEVDVLRCLMGQQISSDHLGLSVATQK